MAKVDYSRLAADIISEVGGAGNVATASHCATRLRLKLKDQSKASKTGVEALDGVLSVVEAGGQFQVVIGNDVPLVYEQINKIPGVPGGGSVPDDEDQGEKGNIFNQFIAMISSIFLPFLWPLAGIGLLKAFISLAVNFNWLEAGNGADVPPPSSTYEILNATSDAVFYFLPIFLAITAARRFRADQFTAVAIAGALVDPNIVGMTGAEGVTFFGIPVVMISYTSSVIPILFAVWIQGYVERGLRSFLPSSVRNFTVPLITAFVPIMMNDYATIGHSLLAGPLVAAVIAQAAAALAVVIRTRSKKRRELAAPGIVSGFFAGITEPLIYGVNLPMKLPFYFGLAGGAVGGMIAALGASASDAFVMASLLALPAYMNNGSFVMQIIGTGAAIVIAFTLTLLFGVNKNNDKADGAPAADSAIPADAAGVQPEAAEAAAAATKVAVGTLVKIAAPVAGKLVAVSEVDDKVFASGALGAGVGVIPAEATVVSPVSGTIATVFPTGHAYGIKTADGVEVLVHIGIDTVAMKGEGFESKVSKGEAVEAGQPLAVVDFDKVKEAGYDPTVIVVVTNTKKLSSVVPVASGPVVAGDASMAVEI